MNSGNNLEIAERIEAAGERVIAFLGRVEERLSESQAIEGRVIAAQSAPQPTSTTTASAHTQQPWERTLGYIVLTILGVMLLRRLRRA